MNSFDASAQTTSSPLPPPVHTPKSARRRAVSASVRHELAIRHANSQHGVISREQLLRLGFTDSSIRSFLNTRRFSRLASGVYNTVTGSPSVQALRWTAVLRCGPGAYLFGRSALVSWGFREYEADAKKYQSNKQIRIGVPFESRLRVEPWITVIRARADREVLACGDLPVEAPAYALIDSIREVDSHRDALHLVVDAIQQRVVTVPKLKRAVHGRKIPHRAAVNDALVQLDDGRTSALEIHAKRDVVDAHGLPGDIAQAPFEFSGVRQTVDIYFAEFGVVVELDGQRGHSASRDVHRDMERDNRAALAGLVTLRFGWSDVRRRPCSVARQISEVLIQRGWAGLPTSCSRRNCSIRSICG